MLSHGLRLIRFLTDSSARWVKADGLKIQPTDHGYSSVDCRPLHFDLPLFMTRAM